MELLKYENGKSLIQREGGYDLYTECVIPVIKKYNGLLEDKIKFMEHTHIGWTLKYNDIIASLYLYLLLANI